MMFQPLGSAEQPSLCLFFVYAFEAALEDRLTPGIASLITKDGLAATMTHVVMDQTLKLGPGGRIWLIHIATRVALQADVVETGWMGPDWQRQWKNPSYMVPEELDRDIAFLQLDLSTCSVESRYRVPEASARDVLCQKLRVLPLGVPGYKFDSGTPLAAWRTHWLNRDGVNTLAAFESSQGIAYFESTDRSAMDTMQLKSTTIEKGFSGSPLWDDQRRVAVGFVRRDIDTMYGRFQATDARALTRHPSVQMTLDDAARQLSHQLHGARERRPLSPASDNKWIEPAVREMRFDPETKGFGAEDDGPSMPALAALHNAMAQRQLVVVMGGAGSGKTRLMVEAANTFSTEDRLAILVSAQDVTRSAEASLSEQIERAVRGWGVSWPRGMSLSDILKTNGLALDVFIDGLDELSRGARVRLIHQLLRFVSVGMELPIASIIVASRVIDELYDHRLLAQAIALDLMPLEVKDIEALIAQRFPSPEKAQLFRSALATNRLLHEGGNPLQLTLAATVFETLGSLPKPSELVSTFIGLEIDRMRDEAAKARKNLRNREMPIDESYYEAARTILSMIGLVTLQSREAVTRESLPDEIGALAGKARPAWLEIPGLLLSFIDRELSERCGLIDTRESIVKWLHQSIADQCAADAVLRLGASNREVVKWAFRQVLDTARHGFVMNLLSTMSANGNTAAVDAFAREIADLISVQPRAILIPLHLIASDVELSEVTTRRVVQQFCRVVLADQLRQTCAELMTFRPSDLMDLAALCRHARIRPLVIAAIEERLRVRRQTEVSRTKLARKREAAPTGAVILTEREEEVLRKLDLKNEIRIPMVMPRGASGIGPARRPPAPTMPIESNGQVTGVVHLSSDHGETLLSASAPEFAESLITFARESGDHAPPADVLLMYLRLILRSARDADV